MYKIRTTILFVMLFSWTNTQSPASIVYDPTNGATLSNVFTVIKDLKETSDSWRANAEFLDKVVNQGKEVKRLVALLESIICATDETAILIRVDHTFELCEKKLELDITLGKIEGVSERLKLIVTGSVLLSQFETIQSLKDLNDELEDAIRQTNTLNEYMRYRLDRRLEAEYNMKHYGEEDSPLIKQGEI